MIKVDLKNNKYLTLSRGKFDDWCVYEVDENGIKKAPLDIEYFTSLNQLCQIFNPNILYDDFIKLYDETTSIFKDDVILDIEKLVEHYNEYADEVFRIFCILYMAMIAEQNKKHTKLGKRIKRLGMYNLLIKRLSPSYCANFMRNMDWKTIDKLCLEGGF